MSSLPYPSSYALSVILRDGTPVILRPIRPQDAASLQEGFSRLSSDTIYMRALFSLTALTEKRARELATVDYDSSMAFVAAIQEDGQERLIALAQYNRIGDPALGQAEVGVVVRDDYQKRGLGTLIMQHLARYAHHHGITALIGSVHVNNQRILKFIRDSGLAFEKRMVDGGVWEVRIDLTNIG